MHRTFGPRWIYLAEDGALPTRMLAQPVRQHAQGVSISVRDDRAAWGIEHRERHTWEWGREHLCTRSELVSIKDRQPMRAPAGGAFHLAPAPTLQRVAEGVPCHRLIPGVGVRDLT